ncbi:MAG: pyridoxal phosphate-dependent aminotransferase [Desulfurococcaceae archaeon]
MNSPVFSYKKLLENMLGEGGFKYIARGRELARKGFRVINLSIGQPDVPTPDNVIESAVNSLVVEKFTRYTETQGIPELREAIADYLNQRYGSDVKPDEVIVGPGAKGPIFLAIAAYVSSGDEVIVPEPTYPAYSEVAKLFGARVVYVSLLFRNTIEGFKLDIESIENAITPRTKLIVINNPHNPTGAVFTREELDQLVEIARKKGILILADEIYDNFVYEGEFNSFLSYSDWRDWLIYVNGFSKTFSMTGWRLGYLVIRREIAEVLRRLAVNIWGCPTSFIQKAGVTALKDPESWIWVKKLVDRYREMCELMYSGLKDIPFIETWKSRGAFYMFPRVVKLLEKINMDVETFVEFLIDRYQLIVLPGSAFPAQTSNQYIRFSFATNRDEVEEGVKRFKEAVYDLTSK